MTRHPISAITKHRNALLSASTSFIEDARTAPNWPDQAWAKAASSVIKRVDAVMMSIDDDPGMIGTMERLTTEIEDLRRELPNG